MGARLGYQVGMVSQCSNRRGVCRRAFNRLQVAFLASVIFLSACATLPPFATEESVKDREICLYTNRVWVETQNGYSCVTPTPLQREETKES